jgi:sulfate adenylyltransferase subunit 1
VIELDRELDIGRGDLLTKPGNQPQVAGEFEAMLCWLGDRPLDPARPYVLQHLVREARCRLGAVRYKLDVTTLHRVPDPSPLQMNDLARVTLQATRPLFFDSYKKNRQTGRFILVDEATNATVGAGMIL